MNTAWSEAGNWAGDAAGTIAGAVPQSTDTLVFDSANVGLASFASNNDVAGLTGLTLQITDASATSDFTITGVATGVGSITNNQSAGTATGISTPLTFAAPATITNSAGGLNINTTVNNGGNLLTVDTTGATTLGGVVSGAGGLTKNGSGNLTTIVGNTFNGAVNINGGTFIYPGQGNADPTPFGAGAKTVTLSNGGAIRPTSSSDPSANTKSFVMGTGGGVFDVPAGAALLLNDANQYSGAGALTKIGAGDVVMNNAAAASTFASIDIVSGRLFFDSQNVLGPNPITVRNGGTLNFSPNVALTLANQLTLLDGANVSNRQNTLTLPATTILPTAGTVVFNRDDQNTGTIIVLSSVALTGDLTIQGGNTGAGGNGGTVRFDGVISENIAGANITKTGNGSAIFNAANTYSGTTTILNGNLMAQVSSPSGAAGAFGNATSEILLGDTAGANAAGLLANGAITFARPIRVRAGSTGVKTIGQNSNNASTFSGTVTLDTHVTLVGNSNTATFTGQFTDSAGTFNVTKAGGATVVLSSTNAYDGLTIITGGTLSINADDRLGPAPGAATPGKIVLNGGALQASATFALNANRGIAVGTGQGSIDVTGANTLTYDGIIADNGVTSALFAKTGSGTLALGNTNTYSGITAVNGGTLQANAPGALGATSAGTRVASGATLAFSGNFTIANEPITLTGLGLNNTAGALSTTGNITIPNTTAIGIAGSSSIISNSGTLTINANLIKSFESDITLGGAGNIDMPASIVEAANATFTNVTGRLFMATGQGIANNTGATNINTLAFTGTPAQTATNITTPLYYLANSDYQFTSVFGGTQPGTGNFTAVYVADVVITRSGNYSFTHFNNDDSAATWLDLGRDGVFDATDRLVSTGINNATGLGTVALTPGTYKVAFAVEDTGGGSGLSARFESNVVVPSTNIATMPIVNGINFPVSNNLFKVGAGNVRLGGANAYAGHTNVVQGTLTVANNTALGAPEGAGVMPLTPTFSTAWQAGTDNNSNSEFAAENGNSNAAPGQAGAVVDDDWYFAGTYPAPIGVVATTDPLTAFERALTTNDTTDRIHFNLTDSQLDDNFRLIIDIVAGSYGGSDIPIDVFVNGTRVHYDSLSGDRTLTTVVFNGQQVGLTTGDNVVTLSRRAAPGPHFQFDFVRLESQAAVAGSGTVLGAGAVLAFDGSAGNLNVGAETVTVAARTPASSDAIVNVAGTNAFAGSVVTTGVMGKLGIRSDAGQLTIGGTINFGANQLIASGAGNTVLAGQVSGAGITAGYAPTVLGTANLVAYYQLNETSGTTITDSGPNGLHGAIAGTVALGAASQNPALGTAMTFNGTNTYVPLATSATLGLTNSSFTASAWIFANDTGGDKTIFGTDVASNNNGLHLIIRAGKMHMGFYGNDTAGVQTIGTGQWYHVAWRYDAVAQQQAIYVNGVLDAQSTGRAPFSGNAGAAMVNLGRWNNGNYFNGQIDEAAIVGRAMTDAEIANLFSQGSAQGPGTTTVIKNGAGALTLAAINNYVGNTVVNVGTLFVNGAITSNTSYAAGSTLAGSGVINGNVAGSGTVAPGNNNVGTLTINGNFTPAGSVSFTLNSPYQGAGTDYDQLIVNGTNNLSAATITLSGGTPASFPAPLRLISKTSAGATTAASTPAEGSLVTVGAMTLRVNYNAGDGNDVVLTNIPSVVYVNDDWAAFSANTPIADGDLGTAAAEPATIGGNAFGTLAAAIAAVGASGIIIINDGTYAETAALDGGKTLRLTRLNPTTDGTVTIGSLDAIAGTTIDLQSNLLRLGDATGSNLIAGTLSGAGGLTKLGADTLTLVGAGITFRGNLNVNAGKLTLQDTTAFANGNYAVAQQLNTVAGATLEFNVTTGQHLLGTNNGGVTIGGNGTVLKTGTGLLALDEQGNNTFQIILAMTGGTIDIQGGTIRNGGWQGQTWTNNRAALNIGAAGTFDIWDGNNVTIDALTGSGNFVRSVGGGNGTLTLGANNGSGDFTGAITIAAGAVINVVKTGTGTQTFSGNNTYAGTTTVNAGTLRLNHANALGSAAGNTTVASGGTLDLNGQTISGETVALAGTGVGGLGALINSSATPATWAGTVASGTYTVGGTGDINLSGQVSTTASTLTKIGTHKLTFSGTLDNIGLAVIVSAGTAVLAKTSTGGVHSVGGAAAVVTVNSGGTAQLGGSGGDQIYVQGDVVVNAGGTLDMNGVSEGFDALSGGGNVINSSATPVTLTVGEDNSGSTFTGQISGALTLRKVGGGEFVVTNGSNSYSGGTVVEGGLFHATDNTIGSGNLTLNGGTFFNDAGSGAMTADNNFSKTITLGAAGGGIRAGWAQMTVSGQITGAGALTIVNDNTITLANPANDYSGNTIIGAAGSGNNAGLRLGANNVIPSGAGKGNVVFSASAGGTAVLDLGGFNDTINGLVGGGAGANLVDNTIGGGTYTLTVGDANAGSTFSSPITDTSGTLALTKIGTGTLTLNNAAGNTYSGTTTVNGGTLLASNTSGSATGSGNVDVQTGGTLGGAGIVSGPVSISGTLAPGNIGATGILTLGSTLAFTSTGRLAAELNGLPPGVGHDQLIVGGAITIASGAQLLATRTYNALPGETFTLVVNNSGASVNGTFASAAQGQSVQIGGQRYYITYLAGPTPGNDIALVRNHDLVANNDTFGPILMNASFSDNVQTNANPIGPDIDVDGDGVFSIVTAPAHGSVVLDPLTGEFTYTPAPNYVGVDTFVYRLSDGEFSDTATVTLTISRTVVDGSTLYVAGSNAADRIVLSPGVLVRINNVNNGPFGGVDKVVVCGNGGDDTITAASNFGLAVELYGDAGNDYLAGAGGTDMLLGGEGNDRLMGGNGDDIVYGGGGTDTLAGGNGNDTLYGDQDLDRTGAPLITTKAAKDTLNGDAGSDLLYGDAGTDLLYGGAGNDFLDGGADADTLDGGDGSDMLLGGLGSDKLNGRGGRDVLVGGSGIDSLLGGASADLLYGGNLDSEDYTTLWDMALLWFNSDPTAVDTFATAATGGDDVLSDTLNGEADSDWFLIFKLDTIASTEKFPANNKVLLN